MSAGGYPARASVTDARALRRTVEDALEGAEWKVEQAAPDARDLVAHSPDGRTFAIELTTGLGPMHFAAVADVDRVAQQLGSHDSGVTPVLLTTRSLSPTIEGIASTVGVSVVRLPLAADGEVDLAALSGSLVAELDAVDPRP